MQHSEPPPRRKPGQRDVPQKFQQVFGTNAGKSDIPLRKACVSDVKGILELVNGFAASNLMLPRGPQYLYENISDFVVAVDDSDISSMGAGDSEKIVACGSLHILWDDLAEIRSVAIHPDFQKRGLGKKIVQLMKEDARRLGIKKLFTFTLAEAIQLPFPDNTFDLVTISFATRNINVSRDILIQCFREFHRIVKPGGRFVNLETSQPPLRIIRWLIHTYVHFCDSFSTDWGCFMLGGQEICKAVI